MWTFEQSTGRMTRPTHDLLAKGYAGGNCGNNPEGKNNPSMQDCKEIGPLPVGFYMLGQLIERHPRLGPFVIVLIPDVDNEMFGRGDFRIHGDTTPAGNASEGCIILPRWARLEMAHSDDRRLQVVSIVEDVGSIA